MTNAPITTNKPSDEGVANAQADWHQTHWASFLTRLLAQVVLACVAAVTLAVILAFAGNEAQAKDAPVDSSPGKFDHINHRAALGGLRDDDTVQAVAKWAARTQLRRVAHEHDA